MDILKSILTFIFSVVAVVLIVVFLAPVEIYWGYVQSILWNWFIVPFGAHPISIAQALGISTVVSSFLLGITVNLEDIKSKLSEGGDNKELMWKGLKSLYFNIPVGISGLWLFGWIVHHFV